MHTLYATSMTTLTIQKLLGSWLQSSTHSQCEWTWLACPVTLKLYHKHGHRWHMHIPEHHCRRYTLYATTPSSIKRHLPTTATPATPSQTPEGDTIILNLPIYPWDPIGDHTTLTEQQANDSDSSSEADTNERPILECLMNPAMIWEQDLWHQITCHS